MKKNLLLIANILFCFAFTSAHQKPSRLNGNINVDSHAKIIGSKTSEEIFLAQLHGKITNQNNEAIPGATILVIELSSGTKTTSDGLFSFQLPAALIKLNMAF